MTRIAIFNPQDWYDRLEVLGQSNMDAVGDNHRCVLRREMYDRLHEAGMLVCVGVFAGVDLVGYAIATVSPYMHHAGIVANHDGIFVAPAYRRPRLGWRLMDALERECRARGATAIAWHATPHTEFARLLARRATLEEFTYIKEL